MADSDLVIKTFIMWRILPVCGLVVSLVILRKRRKKVAAWVMQNVFSGPMNKATRKQKSELFDGLSRQRKSLGRPLDVLEIGAGSGPNFPFFPAGSVVTCLEPNEEFNPYILTNAKKHGLNLEPVVKGFAERMDMFDDETFDAVVCTFVLCSVRSPEEVFKEVKRVLKPGGKFYIIEHIVAERKFLRYLMQKILNPVWGIFLDGCQITRDTPTSAKQAGFSSCDIQRFDGTFPFVFVIKPLCMGSMTK